jgi:glycosyltransferase involved in cell wall biosynthesis
MPAIPRARSGSAPVADLAAIVLTFNEERHVGRLLDNLQPLCKAVYVIDSFSTDQTVPLAEAKGARVLRHRFVNYAQQFEWAMRNAPIETAWVIRIDADEILSSELIAEIDERLPQLAADITGVNMNRRHIFLGRWVRHGGRYPLTLLRIWRRGCAEIEQRWMDEHMLLTRGRAITLTCDFSDHNLNDLTFFTAKHNNYATREALDQIIEAHRLNQGSYVRGRSLTSAQAARKRFFKSAIYNRLPLWAGPLAYFLFRYLIQFGFLDRREGLVYHVLQGFWYRFLVAAKVFECEQRLAAARTAERRIEILSEATGYPVASFLPSFGAPPAPVDQP